MPHLRAALFDVDGTLADTLQTLTDGLADGIEFVAGIRPTRPEIRALIGMPLAEQLQLFVPTRLADERLNEAVEFTIDRFHQYQATSRLYDDAVEALRLCRDSGLGTALVTSKSTPELNRFLERFPLRPLVQAIVCASDVERPKPHPDTALLACTQLSIGPEEAVYVGDSIYDARCARDAGMTFVAVTYGASTREELSAEGAIATFDEPAELLSWFNHTLRISCHVKS